MYFYYWSFQDSYNVYDSNGNQNIKERLNFDFGSNPSAYTSIDDIVGRVARKEINPI